MYQLITAKDNGTDPIIIKLKKKPPTLYDIVPKKVIDNIYTIPYDKIGGWVFYYATDAIKGRWIEGEEVIKRDSELAYCYAKYTIEGKWVEGEEAIKRNDYWWKEYQKRDK